jgi:hypothetical protein
MRLREALVTLSAAIISSALHGAPLDKNKVADDAKWVVHLDFDAFRVSKLGSYLTDNLLQPKLEAAESAKKLKLSVSFRNISSITAYGVGYEKNGEGVMLIQTTANVKDDLDALAGLNALAETDDREFKVVQQEPFLLYSMDDELFIAPGIEKTVVVAKSKKQIANAREVLLGKAANLTASKAFSEFPTGPDAFFFVGMAEGLTDNIPIPPQAKVLKETRGGRLVIGEKAENLFINVVFRGKSAEACTNVSQVLQGLVALAKIMPQQNEDVTALANSAQIGTKDQNVMLTLQLPISKAINKINEHHNIEP